MKICSFLTLCMVLININLLQAQSNLAQRVSPPAEASEQIGDLKIDISYSRPSVKGRTIWGVLVPYNRVWRTGANEATTFKVNKNVKVEGEALPAGRYALFTIPGKDTWTVIFNKEPDQWGSFRYDESQDALRIEVNPQKVDQHTESLAFQIDKSAPDTGEVRLFWEKLRIHFSVQADE